MGFFVSPGRSKQFFFKLFAVFFSLSVSSVAICANSSTISEREMQVRKNLCTLSLFLQLGIQGANNPALPNTKSAVYDLVGMDSEDADYHAANGYGLAEIYLGGRLQKKIPLLAFSNFCDVGFTHELVEKVAIKSHLKATENIARIRSMSLRSTEGKISLLMKIYAEEAFNAALLEKSAIHKIVNDNFTNPWKGEYSSDKFLDGLLHASSAVENPLYWTPNLLLPYPNTPCFWDWYAHSLPQVEKLFKDAIRHIKDGTFDDWWLQ